ncbi:MAG: hypothetical protein OEW19_12490 [Acidobacteriota bacterium]|nr:hypothetical protein [Acidobacteriota bacterium]
MKASGKVPKRLRAQARDVEALQGRRAHDEVAFTEDRSIGPQLPLSLAPYRLQAADRWWRESGSMGDTPRKRPS